MAKPVGELLQDYVDARLGCGGCILGVIGTGAFVWAFMQFAKKMIEIYSDVNWLMWLAVALFIVTAVIAVGFCISTIKHHCQIGGGVMLFDAFAQIAIAIYQFSVDGGGWDNFFFGILFALVSLVCGLMMVAATE